MGIGSFAFSCLSKCVNMHITEDICLCLSWAKGGGEEFTITSAGRLQLSILISKSQVLSIMMYLALRSSVEQPPLAMPRGVSHIEKEK